ncbi:hypothetical protein BC940DRAFT_295540 [Gongronella butleri]|nr:hypothetical protein BC940DRAFT_295540 [Gongronella butleri]
MPKRKRSSSLGANSAWLLDTFDTYTLPSDASARIDQGLHYRIRCLGTARLHVHPVLFFEVTKSEISDNDKVDKDALPPKKRKKRHVETSIIFSLNDTTNSSPHLDRDYFQFPAHCLVEPISTDEPFELCCTFFSPALIQQYPLPSPPPSSSSQKRGSSPSQPPRHQRRWTDPGQRPFKEDPMTLPLSGASHDLYQSLKQAVLHYEAFCQQLLDLKQRHTQSLASVQKKQKSSTGKRTANANKQCAYCHSKTTPMWRRGPEGAGTLCNACGVKWKNGKILIPKKSPKTEDSLDVPALSSSSSSESPLPSSFSSSPSPPPARSFDTPNIKLQDVEAAALLTLLKQSNTQ